MDQCSACYAHTTCQHCPPEKGECPGYAYDGDYLKTVAKVKEEPSTNHK